MGTGTAIAPDARQGAWNLFLSSTDADFEPYKRSIRQKLQDCAEVACFHSSGWVAGFADTVEACRNRVEACDGFVLLLGYWYGSIPPNEKKSITNLEFDWAWERWVEKGHPDPPMAVLTPEIPSEAHRQLTTAAEQILAARDANTAAEQKERIKEFRDQVLKSWRVAKYFKSKQDLADKCLVFCSFRRGLTAGAAAEGKVTPERRAPSETQPQAEILGRLGREAQTKAIEKLWTKLRLWPGAPGAAMLIHGAEQSGQREFAAALPRLLKARGQWPKGVRPPDPFTVDKLPQWTASLLKLDAAACDSAEALAGVLAPLLKAQSYSVVLDRVHRMEGGIAAFHAQFWRPLLRRLTALRGAGDQGRLAFYLVDYRPGGEIAGVVAPIGGVAAEAGLSDILLVPELGPFTDAGVTAWLEYLQVPDLPPRTHAAIAARVLRNADDRHDGMPDNVFKRLGDENLSIPEDFT